MTRRRRAWIMTGAALVVCIALALAVLPGLVRRIAISKIRAATGRDVAIEAVHLNLFMGRLAVKGFRLADREGVEPFLRFDELLVRFRVLPLFVLHARLDEVTLTSPTLRVVRTGPKTFNFSDLVAAPEGKVPEGKAPPGPAKAGGPAVDVTVGRFTLAGGAMVVEDRAIAPPRTWKAEGLGVEVTNLTTRAGGPGGTGTVTFTLAGTPITLKASDLRLVPAHADGTLTVQGFDLALLLPYLPTEAPATLQSGHLTATLTLAHGADTGTQAAGDIRLEDLAVLRRGQTARSLSVPALSIALRDMAVREGALTAGHIELQGDPTLFNTNLSPPPRYDLKGLKVIVEDATWPPRRPARLQATTGLPGGGTFEAQGMVQLEPMGADIQVMLKGLDLTLARPYLPPDAPATLGGGRLAASLKLRHGAEGSRADGQLRLENLAVLRQGQTAPSLSAPQLTVGLKGIALAAGSVTAGRIELAGDPSLFNTNLSPPPRYDLKGLKVIVEDATWPPRRPARLQATTGLPGGGRLEARGTVRMAPLGADLRVALASIDLEQAQPYLPIAAPLAGRAEADLVVAASIDRELTATVRGKGGLNGLALGPQDAPVIAVEQAEASGIDVQWPTRVAVGRVVIRKPSALIERDQTGALPLLTMLRRPSPGSPDPPAAPGQAPAPAEAPATPAGSPAAKIAIEIGEIAVEEGYARFVDRTLSPPFAEELSRLAVNIKSLSNAPGTRGRLLAQGVLGGTGALELHGDVAPLGEKLFVDLEGELRDFAIPRGNPELNRLLAWVARDGRLSTKVRLRVDGDQLDANSELVVGRLDLVPSGEEDEVKRRIGLPLGLIVALMKDVRGEIRVNVPVSGSLSSPQFSLGEAIWTAVRNVIVNVLTAPFKLIGRLFTRDNKIEGLDIDPIRFPPGAATVAGPMEEQLKRLGEFLRNSPAIRLTLAPVVSEADMTSLKTQEVTARVQRFQREQRLTDFAAAAARLHRERFPGKPVPKTPEEIVAALREAEPAPEEAGRALAGRRLEVTRGALTKAGDIDGGRLQAKEGAPVLGDSGEGRVEFAIVP